MAALVASSIVTGLVSDVARSGGPQLAQDIPVPHTDFPLAKQAVPVDVVSNELVDASWPRSGKARALSGKRAGDLPVTLVAKPERSFEVEVADQQVSQQMGITGVVVAVKPIDNAADDVSVEIDYAGFRNASGAGFGSRLHLTRLPECALTTPQIPTCQVQTPVKSTNDPVKKTVTAEATSSEPMVFAATAGTSGPSGSFEASSLAPSGAWSVSGSAGAFTWTYPVVLPPASSGGTVAPNVSLSYNASSVDGRTLATNSQSSWLGQGWDYASGSIERSYKTCGQDKALPEAQRTGDLCWAGQVVTMNLNGQATSLVFDDASKTWRASTDGGARIQLLTGASNGVHDGQYWKVTNTDGVSYYFGRNRGPGYTNQEQTNSAWTVPVYGPRNGDPCYQASGFADSKCNQAWRWNLDFVEDPHGNVTTYYYSPETNYYGANLKTTGVPYTRGGVLKRIDYGLRNVNGSIYGAVAPNQVVFDVAERCLPEGAITCDPSQFTAANAKHWPDTPQDQDCKQGASCGNYSPSFWSTKRLQSITTQYNQGSGPVKVDRYQLGQDFKNLVDKELWLQSITRTGYDKDGQSITVAPISFTGQAFDNRVQGYGSMPALAHWRITNIWTETGTVINVT